MSDLEVPVLIVGGSLVGMSSAMLLGHYGIRSLVVEHHRGTAIHPRAAQISQRTMEIFRTVGAEIIEPSCGACINAGPGVSYERETVTVSAINRNFPGRSGPGQLYLASPYTTAASALAGYIKGWEVRREMYDVRSKT